MASNDIGGVWRTIGGRRVFIKDKQSLSDAMKESGKFKLSKKQIEAGERLTKKAKQNAREDISRYLRGNKYDWDSDEDFVRDLADEYNLELNEAKKMFSEGKSIEANKSPGQRTVDIIKDNNVRTFADEIKEQSSNEKYTVDYFKQKGVEIKDNVPKGYVKVENATTAPNGYEWYSNNKSMFGGEREHILVKKENQLSRSLKQKAYQKYLKEHPASKMTFEQFKKMQ